MSHLAYDNTLLNRLPPAPTESLNSMFSSCYGLIRPAASAGEHSYFPFILEVIPVVQPHIIYLCRRIEHKAKLRRYTLKESYSDGLPKTLRNLPLKK
jgi:hypothetical protein